MKDQEQETVLADDAEELFLDRDDAEELADLLERLLGDLDTE